MSTSEFVARHPVGVSVSRHLTERQLLGDMPSAAESKRDMGNGWVWYQLPPYTDGEVMVHISLGFNQGVLTHVQLSDGHPRYGATWAEWSEGSERQRASSIGAWLTNMGFPAGTYTWGTVWYGYDSKGGTGSALVTYSRNGQDGV